MRYVSSTEHKLQDIKIEVSSLYLCNIFVLIRYFSLLFLKDILIKINYDINTLMWMSENKVQGLDYVQQTLK